MELRELRVRNIRSFEEARLRLGPGTTLIWGDVGAGKTSLLYAIEMALFGFAEVEPAHLMRHRASTAEVRLTIAGDGHEYAFERRVHRRMRRGKDLFEPDDKGTGLVTDGVAVRYPATELRQRAIDLLGFPDNPNPRAHSDLWRWAVYVPQERMRQVLDAADAESRLDTVRKALGLERYRTAAENAQLAVRELRNEAVLQEESAARWETAEEELANAERARAAAEGSRDRARTAEVEHRTKLAKLEREEAERTSEIERLEADRRELTQLQARSDELTQAGQRRSERRRTIDLESKERHAAMPTLRERAGGLSEARADQARAAGTVETARAESAAREIERRDRALAEAALKETGRRRADAQVAVDRARAALAEARRQAEAPELAGLSSEPAPLPGRALPEIETATTSAIAQAEQAAGRLRECEGTVAELRSLTDRGLCPRCGQAVTGASFRAHLVEAEGALEDARRAYTTATDARRALADERTAREAAERRLQADRELRHRREERETALVRADEERLRREVEYDARTSEEREARVRLEGMPPPTATGAAPQDPLEAALERFRRATDRVALVERADHELEVAELTLREIERERTALEAEDQLGADATSAIDGRKAELTRALAKGPPLLAERAQAQASLSETRGALERALGLVHRSEAEVRSADDRIAEAQARANERGRLLGRARRLRASAEFLSGPFREAMLEIERRLLGRAKGEFDRRFARYFAALVEDPALTARADAGFSPSVELEGETTPPEALSGGERTALALAYRLALGEVVRGLDRLNLSTVILDEPTDGFSPEQVQRMGELIQALGGPQVILVSHEAALAGVADRVVRVRKNEGRSELLEEADEAPTGPPGLTTSGGTSPRPTARAPRR